MRLIRTATASSSQLERWGTLINTIHVSINQPQTYLDGGLTCPAPKAGSFVAADETAFLGCGLA
jgi:hypothetical protein